MHVVIGMRKLSSMPKPEEKSSAKVAHNAVIADSNALNPMTPNPNTKQTAQHANVPLQDFPMTSFGPPIVVPTTAATGSPKDKQSTDKRATLMGNAKLAAVPKRK